MSYGYLRIQVWVENEEEYPEIKELFEEFEEYLKDRGLKSYRPNNSKHPKNNMDFD